jgi:hypothetical protein
VRIRYDFRDDWTGDPSVFFRIVLKDAVAAKESKLGEIARTVSLDSHS